MSTEALSTSNGFVLAPRAVMVQLTLELRASMHEVAAAEADYAEVAAVAQLRARLAPMMDARRRSLDEALAHAEDDSVAAVATARLEAASIVAGSADVEPVEVMTTMVERNQILVFDDVASGHAAAVERYDASTPGVPTVNIALMAEAPTTRSSL